MPLLPPSLHVSGHDLQALCTATALVRFFVDHDKVDDPTGAVEALLLLSERILRDAGLYDARGVGA